MLTGASDTGEMQENISIFVYLLWWEDIIGMHVADGGWALCTDVCSAVSVVLQRSKCLWA